MSSDGHRSVGVTTIVVSQRRIKELEAKVEELQSRAAHSDWLSKQIADLLDERDSLRDSIIYLLKLNTTEERKAAEAESRAAAAEDVITSARRFCALAPPWGHVEGPTRLQVLRGSIAAYEALAEEPKPVSDNEGQWRPAPKKTPNISADGFEILDGADHSPDDGPGVGPHRVPAATNDK